ncbi:DUF309 domain-containing protein [Haloarchaeobius amylolyticus]|uniref:DUF309 domain-containing protein n=1 Tax=Haloarchaeobius amylolyticus TaxID=1198296 RepID=UPI002270A5F3|nr:DUF309 domain-containing protein [Haloarchaeobius amylolyticus]
MRDHLRAGLAIYNAGDLHDAHDAWEDHWLDLPDGHEDERLLHGLIQFTAAFHHAANRNWTGCVGLAASAGGYLAGLPADHRGIDVPRVRRILAALEADPEVVERRSLPTLRHEGAVVTVDDLDLAAVAVAARVYAEDGPYDEEVLASAVRFAREDREDGAELGRFESLLRDFVADPENRGLVYQRLEGHVSKRESKESDVEGLFG